MTLEKKIVNLKCRGWTLKEIAEFLNQDHKIVYNLYQIVIYNRKISIQDLPEYKKNVELILKGKERGWSVNFIAELYGFKPKFVDDIINPKKAKEKKKIKNACKICGRDKGANRYWCNSCHSNISKDYYGDCY